MALTLKRCILLAAGFTAGLYSFAAGAQEEPQRNATVTDRFRPEFSPIGMKQGGFLILPKVHVSESYDDNILAADTGTKDDFITTVEPAVNVVSQWSQHALNFNAQGRIAHYASNSDEDFYNFTLGAAGRIDITRDSYVDGGVSYRSAFEERTSADDAGGSEPTEYSVVTPKLGLFNRWNRVSLLIRGQAEVHNYDDVTASSGALVDNDDRDRMRYEGSVRLGYEIVPQYEAFVQTNYNKIDYDQDIDSSGFNRDSDGYEAVAGLRIDITNVLFGDVFAGYRKQNYDDASLEAIDGVTYGGALTWNPTRLTTVVAAITRNIQETTQADASGYFATEYRASVDHEVLRNLIVGATTSYTVNQYKGNGRDDDDLGAGVYARYLMYRNLYLSASYSYQQRESNVASADFDKNVFMLRLETQF